MAKKSWTQSERIHIEHFVQTKERERLRHVPEADIERILTGMDSEDEVTRAKAVREICPCRMPWEVFTRLRKTAQRLQQDPSPLVAANARHIEEDARRVAEFEAQAEQIQEYEEAGKTRSRKERKKT